MLPPDRTGRDSRRTILLAGLTLTLLAPPARGDIPPPCPPGEPRVEVRLEDPPPPLLSDLSVADLHARSGLPQSERMHHLGVTASRVEWRFDMQTRFGQAAPGGPVCMVPALVRLTIVHAAHSIHVAREIPHDTCLFREVEAHERRHVEVNRRTLRAAQGRARSALEAWARGAEARAPTNEQAAAVLREAMTKALEPVLARLQAERRQAHAEIDTPEEYHRMSRVCAVDQIRLRDRLFGGPPPKVR